MIWVILFKLGAASGLGFENPSLGVEASALWRSPNVGVYGEVLVLRAHKIETGDGVLYGGRAEVRGYWHNAMGGAGISLKTLHSVHWIKTATAPLLIVGYRDLKVSYQFPDSTFNRTKSLEIRYDHRTNGKWFLQSSVEAGKVWFYQPGVGNLSGWRASAAWGVGRR
jgi:hypothetical protein